jgi:serine/threonine-protein kinase
MAVDGREVPAIVMEFVEGRTLESLLRDKFDVRSLKFEVSDVFKIAAQIADALEAAHDAGIVHRDLKPANVIVRADGVVKVLDFGLAKSPGEQQPGGEADALTVTSPAMTQAGVILGTAAYMSPEQAKGRVADRRADIWAFGAVLFEMLTGERLFAGQTVTEVLAAVLKDPVRLDRLPPETPAALRQLLGRCLERDQRMRLRDIGEARIALAAVRAGDRGAQDAERAGPDPSSSRGRRAAIGAIAALTLAGLAAYVAWQAKPASSIPVRRFELPAGMAAASVFAVSPDGSRIAYVAQGHLVVYTLATAATADLGIVPVTAASLLWSPDGRRLAYSADSDLRIIPSEGGAAAYRPVA